MKPAPLLTDERIAELVRPHAITPEARKVLEEAIRQAVRETALACAQICDDLYDYNPMEEEYRNAAAAIRERIGE